VLLAQSRVESLCPEKTCKAVKALYLMQARANLPCLLPTNFGIKIGGRQVCEHNWLMTRPVKWDG
jgi:hypothetical protein